MKYLLETLLGIPKALMGAFILTKLWGWFIAPKFNLPYLGVIDAIGIMSVIGLIFMPMIVSMYKPNDSTKDQKENWSLYMSLAMMVIFYPLTLLFGYVWHQFQ